MSVEIITLPPDAWPEYRAVRLESLREEPQAFGSTFADMALRPDEYWRGRLEDASLASEAAAAEELPAAEELAAMELPSAAENLPAAKQQKSWLLFARHEGKLVGMIGAVREEDAADTAHIVSVYVSKQARGLGVGKALMAAILDAVARAGFRKASLGVNAEQAAAVGLYRRFGFEVVEERTEVQGDGIAHLGYIMEKRLDPRQ